jgi:hypothetical protein
MLFSAGVAIQDTCCRVAEAARRSRWPHATVLDANGNTA